MDISLHSTCSPGRLFLSSTLMIACLLLEIEQCCLAIHITNFPFTVFILEISTCQWNCSIFHFIYKENSSSKYCHFHLDFFLSGQQPLTERFPLLIASEWHLLSIGIIINYKNDLLIICTYIAYYLTVIFKVPPLFATVNNITVINEKFYTCADD